jgi:hypothetical protein
VQRDVACAFEHDLERVLEQRQRTVEPRAHREARPVAGGSTGGHRLPVDERPDVRAQVVVLAIDARLQLRQLAQRLLRLAALEELAARFEPHVHAREGLHGLVVQRARDALALCRRLERAHLRLEDEPLLAEVSHQVAGDDDVRGAHDVEGQAPGVRDQDEPEIEQRAGRGDQQREPEARAERGDEDGEREEHVERAVRALGDERDDRTEQHVHPRGHAREPAGGDDAATLQDVQRQAVHQVRQHHRQRQRIEHERAARQREPSRQGG